MFLAVELTVGRRVEQVRDTHYVQYKDYIDCGYTYLGGFLDGGEDNFTSKCVTRSGMIESSGLMQLLIVAVQGDSKFH